MKSRGEVLAHFIKIAKVSVMPNDALITCDVFEAFFPKTETFNETQLSSHEVRQDEQDYFETETVPRHGHRNSRRTKTLKLMSAVRNF